MNKPYVSIILPTYNEAENICALITALHNMVEEKKEILVLDDNSPDGTADIAIQYCNAHHINDTKVIKRTTDKGLTNSIWHGITVSRGTCIVWMDCDFSHPPEVVPLLISCIKKQQYKIAVASRYIKGGKPKHIESTSKDSRVAILLSQLLNLCTQAILGNWFHDYTSGFVAVKKEVFSKVHLSGDYGEYFIDFIYKAKANNFNIIEIPFSNKPREKGTSKTGGSLFRMMNLLYKYVRTIISLWTQKNILHTIP